MVHQTADSRVVIGNDVATWQILGDCRLTDHRYVHQRPERPVLRQKSTHESVAFPVELRGSVPLQRRCTEAAGRLPPVILAILILAHPLARIVPLVDGAAGLEEAGAGAVGKRREAVPKE